MVRSLAINLFMAIMVFASAGFALQSIKAWHETSLWDEIATQVELNRVRLNGMQGELDELEQQKCFVSKSLNIYYEYLNECSTWEMAGDKTGETSWQVPTRASGATQYN